MDNKLVHKQRGKLNRVIDELHVGDSVFKTDTEILIGWKNHFTNLSKESDRMVSAIFDNVGVIVIPL
jgi:hypothetical protein